MHYLATIGTTFDIGFADGTTEKGVPFASEHLIEAENEAEARQIVEETLLRSGTTIQSIEQCPPELEAILNMTHQRDQTG